VDGCELQGTLNDIMGRIDILVNNAGYSPAAAMEQLSRSEIKNVFEVNLFSLMQLTTEVHGRYNQI
jgi:short-subunit dehydrogenase